MAQAQVATPSLERAAFAAGGSLDADALDRAILRTVAYAGLFQCPLTPAGVHRLLRGVPASLAAVEDRLRALHDRLELVDDQVAPRGRRDFLELHELRSRHTARLIAGHAGLLRWLSGLPWIRMVALSGACAHDNATDDDVDVFLVTARDRVWTVATASFLAAKALGVRRSLCLNYLIDEAALELPEQDAFTAAEIAGLRPLAGAATYRRFVAANPWLAGHLPNFFAGHAVVPEDLPRAGRPRAERRLAALAPALEAASRRLLGAWLAARIGAAPGVRLERHRLKLHAIDHAPRLERARAECWGRLQGAA